METFWYGDGTFWYGTMVEGSEYLIAPLGKENRICKGRLFLVYRRG
jgi:hypothetical protein